MDELNEVRRLILEARRDTVKLTILMDTIFNMLRNMGVDLQSDTKAENADCLDEAINCYIQYNEYNIDNIMKEIEGAIR